MGRRELARNASRGGGPNSGSYGPSSTVGLRLFDQDLEIEQIDAQLVREPESGELPGGDEPVNREAAPKPEVGGRLLRRQEPTLSRAKLASVTAPAVILGRAASLRAGPCMHVRDFSPGGS